MHLLQRATGLAALAAGVLCGVAPLSAETVWLSSLDLKQMTTGWNTAQTDRGVAGQPLSIGGKKFEHGVGTHAASKLRIDVRGNAKRFIAQVGVDDGAGAPDVVGGPAGGSKELWVGE